MKTNTAVVGLAVLLGGGPLAGAEKAPALGKSQAAEAFARLKTLVGEWQQQGEGGVDRVTYELVAAGSALLERETSDSRPTMLTLYHLDGTRLLLTHYCMAGNQPRMQASRFDPETGELSFEFLDATNLASPAAGHMHSVNLRLVDDAHLTAKWNFYENGRSKFSETARYARVR